MINFFLTSDLFSLTTGLNHWFFRPVFSHGRAHNQVVRISSKFLENSIQFRAYIFPGRYYTRTNSKYINRIWNRSYDWQNFHALGQEFGQHPSGISKRPSSRSCSTPLKLVVRVCNSTKGSWDCVASILNDIWMSLKKSLE